MPVKLNVRENATASQQIASRREHDRKVGFSISVFGCVFVAVVAVLLVVLLGRDIDPSYGWQRTICGVTGRGVVAALLVFAGVVACVATGLVGANLGSKLGKTLLVIGCVAIGLLGMFLVSSALMGAIRGVLV